MGLEYSREKFIEQFPLVKLFLYHITYYREFHSANIASGSESVLWTYTINAHLLQATITWCMVFGTEGHNQTHWKRLSNAECELLQSSFRTRLCEETDLSWEQWNEYWSKMITFRNKYVAHRELNNDNPVPDFSVAIKVALFYDKWVREIIKPDILEEPHLDEFLDKLKLSVGPLVVKLLSVTKAYNISTGQQL